RAAQHPNDAGPAPPQPPVPALRGAVVPDHERDQQADQTGADTHRKKAAAPANGRGGKGERSGRQQSAKRSKADLQTGERGKPIARESPRIDGKRCHQRARGPKPEQGASQDQDARIFGSGEYSGTDHRDRRADQKTKPGAEAVERHADRDLDGRKDEEEDARKQPDLNRRKPQLQREIGRDHADRIAQELADDVNRDERGDERNGGARARRLRTALDAHVPGLLNDRALGGGFSSQGARSPTSRERLPRAPVFARSNDKR